MLAAGGLMALLLMGFAVSTIVAPDEADESPDAPEADGATPDAPEETAGDLSALVFGESGAGDPSEPGDDTAEPDTEADNATGEADDGEAATAPTNEAEIAPDDMAGDDSPPERVGETAPQDLHGTDGDDTLTLSDGDIATGGGGADIFEVLSRAEAPDGERVACITDFDCETDRLILDFDGMEADRPEITVDLETDPGNALVQANGLTVALLEGVTLMDLAAIEVVMSGTPITPVTDAAAFLDGGTESDAPEARAAMEALRESDDADAQTGGIGGDRLDGGERGDALFGNEGDDSLSGAGRNDELYGDDGADEIAGGSGADYLHGGAGDDTLRGGSGGDMLFGGDGDDRMAGGDGDDTLQGGHGADVIDGGDGDDVIDGTFGSRDASGFTDADAGDTLIGGAGGDSLLLGSGDIAIGGAGGDTFLAGLAGAVPGTVTDYTPGEDRIELLYDPARSPDPEVSVVTLEDGSGSEIRLDGTVVLRVAGAGTLDPAQIDLRALVE